MHILSIESFLMTLIARERGQGLVRQPGSSKCSAVMGKHIVLNWSLGGSFADICRKIYPSSEENFLIF